MSNQETNPPKCLSKEQLDQALAKLKLDWQVSADGTEIVHAFKFKGFYKTMAFVNSVAWIAQQEMHHPDMEVSYNQCVIHYTTHDSGGVTENDIKCALRVEALNP